MKRGHAEGFPPVCDEKSRLLILGSFPSVRSREIAFYYGNPQNRFWRTLCGFFGEEIPPDPDGKRAFLLRRRVALWDVVGSCDIVGSSDSSIENIVFSDIPRVFETAHIEKVFCNGSKAYELFSGKFPQFSGMTERLPSTSPANPRFSEGVWRAALAEFLGNGG